MSLLMTVEELAKYLKIKPDTIYKKVRKGELPAVKLGKLLRFPKDAIDQWIQDQAAKARAAVRNVNRRAQTVSKDVSRLSRGVSKILSRDVSDLLEELKKAPLNKKQAALREGLVALMADLSKEVHKASPSKSKKTSRRKSTARAATASASSPRARSSGNKSARRAATSSSQGSLSLSSKNSESSHRSEGLSAPAANPASSTKRE